MKDAILELRQAIQAAPDRLYGFGPVLLGLSGRARAEREAIAFAKGHEEAYLDLSAAFTPLSVRTALTEAPGKCLFDSDAPFGEPKLCKQLIAFVSPSPSVTKIALGGRLLQI